MHIISFQSSTSYNQPENDLGCFFKSLRVRMKGVREDYFSKLYEMSLIIKASIVA